MRDRPVPHFRLLDEMRARMRARHMSHRTEEAYTSWVRRYSLWTQDSDFEGLEDVEYYPRVQ